MKWEVWVAVFSLSYGSLTIVQNAAAQIILQNPGANQQGPTAGQQPGQSGPIETGQLPNPPASANAPGPSLATEAPSTIGNPAKRSKIICTPNSISPIIVPGGAPLPSTPRTAFRGSAPDLPNVRSHSHQPHILDDSHQNTNAPENSMLQSSQLCEKEPE